jgi:hypothetical protein
VSSIRVTLLPVLAVCAVGLASPGAAAAAEAPGWELVANSYPTNFVHGANAVQEVTAGSGSFTLTFEEQTTSAIAAAATAPEVQAALESLPAIGKGNVSVADGGQPSVYVVTFIGLLGNMKVNELGASGASVSVKTQGASSGTLGIDIFNIGAGATEGTITVTDALPPHVMAKEAGEVQISGGRFGIDPLIKHSLWDCTGNGSGPPPSVAGATVVTCTNDPVGLIRFAGGGGTPTSNAFEEFANPQPVLGIAVEAQSSSDEPQHTSCTGKPSFCNRVSIAGGGAPGPASTEDPVTISSRPAPGGLVSANAWFSNADGTVDTQAGSHPYTATTIFNLATALDANKQWYRPGGDLRNLDVQLPPGFVGDLSNMPQCREGELLASQCPPSSMVGNLAVEGSFLPLERRVFNMVAPLGTPAELGFVLEGTTVHITFSVKTGGDNAIVAHVHNIAQDETYQAILTLWGTPQESSHNRWRGVEGGCTQQQMEQPVLEEAEINYCARPQGPIVRPFLTLPTSCGDPGMFAFRELSSWQYPDERSEVAVAPHDANGQPARFTGCNVLDFEPVITAAPQTSTTDTATGLTADVKPPLGGLEEPHALATADIQNTTVTLPQGLVVNPGQAAGLTACGSAEDALTTDAEREHGQENDNAPSCPASSKIGTATIKSPLIESATEKQFDGNVYVLQSNPPEIKLLVAASADGVNIKLVGVVHLNEQTGQLTTKFDGTPQLPFSDFKLTFDGGAKAALDTPARCGTYTTSADFTPWSSPFASDFLTNASFALTQGSGGGACPSSPLPFAPSLTAGSSTTEAGSFTPFTTLLQRGDGQQRIDKFAFTAPPGLAAMISSVPLCHEPQAAQGTCPASSHIGHALVQSGPGASPLTLPQPGAPELPIYLTGPYKGAPFGLSIVTPVIAGPFNLGTIVTRARIEVDRHTAQVTISTDPLPQLVKGVATDLRSIDAVIDRPGFMFNPTSCEPMSFSGTAWGTAPPAGSEAARTAPLSSRFQVGGCRGLEFHPRFSVSTSAHTSKANGASLDVKVAQQGGQANIHKVAVSLPLVLPSRLTTLQQACTLAQFQSNPASCPQGSFVGSATAHTPVLSSPLTGPAILVSNGSAAFPDLVLMLQGEGIRIEVVGNTDIKKGITYSRFETVPDAPISSFELNLPEGPHSALGAFGSLCTPKTVTVKRRVGRRLRNVRTTVPAPLLMPTTITGQNGAVVQQTTKISVIGCPKARKTKKARRTSRSRHHRTTRGHA